MKKTPNAALVSFLTVACTLPVLATPATLATRVENTLIRAVAQEETSPLAQFQQKIKEVQHPAAQPVMEALEMLTPYNKTFETEQDKSALRVLAAKLEGPIAVPWNTYRGNGLKEIFDRYVPNGHGNKEIAKLEYYVKFHTLPTAITDQSHIVSKALPQTFLTAYKRLTNALTQQTAMDEKQLIHIFAQFSIAYNKLSAQDPVLAKSLKNSLLSLPIQTGWDRTHSAKDLIYQLGIKELTEGYLFRSAEEIHDTWNVPPAEAEAFAKLVHQIF